MEPKIGYKRTYYTTDPDVDVDVDVENNFMITVEERQGEG